MNILIIRAFVKLRELLATHNELVRQIDQIEATQKQQPHAAASLDPGFRRRRHPETQGPAGHPRYRLCCPQPKEELVFRLAYQKYNTSGRTCPLASRHGPHSIW